MRLEEHVDYCSSRFFNFFQQTGEFIFTGGVTIEIGHKKLHAHWTGGVYKKRMKLKTKRTNSFWGTEPPLNPSFSLTHTHSQTYTQHPRTHCHKLATSIRFLLLLLQWWRFLVWHSRTSWRSHIAKMLHGEEKRKLKFECTRPTWQHEQFERWRWITIAAFPALGKFFYCGLIPETALKEMSFKSWNNPHC